MKAYQHFLILIVFAFIICACTNIPQAPTKTPTMSPDDMMTAAVSTAEELRRETETQWAIDNPSPTPTDTATPTPEATPTPLMPLIPPTATEAPRPMLRVGDNISVNYWDINDRTNYNFVPFTNLYIEVCYTNEGSMTWNSNFYAMCTNHKNDNIQPADGVKLGKTVETGQKACFSFQRIGASNTALGNHCVGFQLYTDSGIAMRGGYTNVCWTIH